jgi:hypothetical protein
MGIAGWDLFARRRFHIRNRLQPSATVGDDDAMAVLIATAAKVVTFGGFKRRVTKFRVAGVALRDILTCFITCQNCAFFANRIARAASSRDNVPFVAFRIGTAARGVMLPSSFAPFCVAKRGAL